MKDGSILDAVPINYVQLQLRMDNGPELVSLTQAQRPEKHGVTMEFIKPGKPIQSAFIERFNQTYLTEIMDFHLFRLCIYQENLRALAGGIQQRAAS